ncbi:MAG: hypothetical protein C4574_03390 [Candidatus Latescibacterota bacterium]|jgi:hypothetical protein|nr:MAG: hypothetical protein C4574_03390 [Candidatus Latescibacterota bacterium]
MSFRTFVAACLAGAALLAAGGARAEDRPADFSGAEMIFCRFPLAQVVALDGGDAWGVMYADTYGKLHLLRATDRGWKLEWEITNLGAKVRRFFFCDLEADGTMEFVVATVSGRILTYSMETYASLWENLEDRYQSIDAIDVANVDSDPQLEIVFIADNRLQIYDGATKSRQWVSSRDFSAGELLIENVDRDPQLEIILNSGIILDSRFLNVEVEWDKPFGDRIAVADMNGDGFPDIVGEFADYSIRVFDVYSRREVW